MVSLFAIDFLTSALAVVAMLILGLLVFFRGERNFSSSIFLLFATVSSVWGALNYVNYQLDDPQLTLWVIRTVMFLAVLQAFSFFLLIYNFPKSTALPKRVAAILYPLASAVAILTFTPFVFSGIKFVSGGVSQPIPAPGIVLFGLFAVSLVMGGAYILIGKIKRATGLEKLRLKYLLFGVATMFTLIIVFNFLIPVILKNTSFIPLSGVFVLPFIVATTYAIFRHQLFNIRIIATELFATLIIIVFLFNTLLSRNAREILTNGIMFILVTAFGILLVRGTIREIRELQRLSQAKSDFVSIVSHQLRTPLTTIKGFISMMQEGKETAVERKDWLQKTYITNERLIRLVNDILNISRMEEGRLKYEFQNVNIVDIIDGVVMETKVPAQEKGVALLWTKPAEAVPKVRADALKLRQVFLNLIDNGMKYTGANGWVSVRLLHNKDLRKIHVIVQDTGVGLEKDEVRSLFERFSRAGAGQKTNAEGMGIGLYIAKRIMEAHNGKIWAESEGRGMGSKFFVELPTI